MTQVTVTTPYATAMPFVQGTLPGWLDEYNGQRLKSYDLYDDVYDNTPNSVQMMLRGSDEKPIFVPTAKMVVKTLARYVGKNWGFKVGAEGAAEQKTAATEAFGDLFKRERILSKYHGGKKEFLRRGDWVWYVQGDPYKDAGTRLTINCIDPRTYFPINGDPDDVDRVTGARIIEETMLSDGRTMALKVQTWRKPSDPSYPFIQHLIDPLTGELDPERDYPDVMPISYESVLLAYDNWDNPEKRKVLATLYPVSFIEGITQLPLYHIKNDEGSGNPFGKSILAGIETMIAGINQTISDEDLSIAMAGLGMYATDSGRPVNDEGKPSFWALGPQVVVEVGEGKKFERVNGVSSIDPSQAHVKYLEQKAMSVHGISDIATGVTAATESGVALSLRLAPLMDAADEVDLAINDAMNQFFHDLKQWFLVFEEIDLGEVEITSFTDPDARLPLDRAAVLAELQALYAGGIIDLKYMLEQMTEKLGYQFPAGMQGRIEAEAQKKAALADPYGVRAAGELEATNIEDAEVVE